MAFIPLGAFVIFVIADAGGAKSFVHTATYWLHDMVQYCARLFQ